jgi:hypothetical protein
VRESAAQYLEADELIQDLMEHSEDDYINGRLLGPDATEGRTQSHRNVLQLNKKRLSHESAAARLNLGCLEFTIWWTGFNMEEPKTRRDGLDDPEIDIDATRAMKLRFWKWLEKEVEAIGTKDMENFILHAEGLLGWMLDMTHCVKRKSGWYRTGNEEDPCPQNYKKIGLRLPIKERG